LEDAQIALHEAKKRGVETYGLGLGNDSVMELMPGRSVNLNNLTGLPKKLFQLLGQAMNCNH
jgi:hypothetical protein